jgi:hypothetical protein
MRITGTSENTDEPGGARNRRRRKNDAGTGSVVKKLQEGRRGRYRAGIMENGFQGVIRFGIGFVKE